MESMSDVGTQWGYFTKDLSKILSTTYHSMWLSYVKEEDFYEETNKTKGYDKLEKVDRHGTLDTKNKTEYESEYTQQTKIVCLIGVKHHLNNFSVLSRLPVLQVKEAELTRKEQSILRR